MYAVRARKKYGMHQNISEYLIIYHSFFFIYIIIF